MVRGILGTDKLGVGLVDLGGGELGGGLVSREDSYILGVG